MLIAVLRVVIAGGGGWLILRMLGGSASLFTMQAIAIGLYGVANVVAIKAWSGPSHTAAGW
jgi:hypothetical protein